MNTPSAAEAPYWAWLVFGCSVVVLLVVDQLAWRGGKKTARTQALVWSGIWIVASLTFGGFVWIVLDARAAQEYLGAYLFEWTLSLDNLFMFLVIFRALGVQEEWQHRVLFWGIIGAAGFRALFIFAGAAALERWEWVSYVFGATLLFAAWRAFRVNPREERRNHLVAWLSRRFPVTEHARRGRFLRREGGRLMATPLLLALIAVELTDILFAIDSVPAALSITRNLFVVYSSNIFAILGLRAVYLVLAETLQGMRYLHYGLAGVLAFAALKTTADRWLAVPPLLSVAVISATIGSAVATSLHARRSRTGVAPGGP